MDRLIFNTPTRMGGGGDDSTTFIAFTIFFLVFLAFLCLGFIFWQVFAPQSSQAFMAQMRSAVVSRYDGAEDEVEKAILFADPAPPAQTQIEPSTAVTRTLGKR